jgi:cytochrome b involved in lipid metabolism
MFTRKNIAHEKKYIIYENNVYDLENFNRHPAGKSIIIDEYGKDITKIFNDIGHSINAKNILYKYKIGELVDEDKI